MQVIFAIPYNRLHHEYKVIIGCAMRIFSIMTLTLLKYPKYFLKIRKFLHFPFLYFIFLYFYIFAFLHFCIFPSLTKKIVKPFFCIVKLWVTSFCEMSLLFYIWISIFWKFERLYSLSQPFFISNYPFQSILVRRIYMQKFWRK